MHTCYIVDFKNKTNKQNPNKNKGKTKNICKKSIIFAIKNYFGKSTMRNVT